MRDDSLSCDVTNGVLSNTGGHYQNTVIRSQHFNAPRSTFNNVQGTQNNILNVNVNHTTADDSTLCSLPLTNSYNFGCVDSEAKHEKILGWLIPMIPSTNYHQALKTCHSSTCQWFIEDKRFLEWKENSGSLLWLHGKRKPRKIASAVRC